MEEWCNSMQARTENEILEEMIGYAVEEGLITTDSDLINKIREGLRTENQYILLLSTYAYMQSQLEEWMKDTVNDLDISTATGQALDNLGVYLNLPRSMGQPARVQFTITNILAESEDILIPKGTLLVTDEQAGPFKTYAVSEDTIVYEGTTTTTVIAECQDIGYTRALQPDSVRSIVGFEQFTVTQEQAGTNGSSIESDDDYRIRLLTWQANNEKGTYDCINNYLLNYTGVSSFSLVPRYAGIGTLKIVVDTTQDLLQRIADDVYNNCMLISDCVPMVVLPNPVQCPNLTFSVKLNNKLDMPLEEIRALIEAQINIFITGGTSRLGMPVNGFVVGQSFEPSNCIRYLMDEFPEIDNIIISSTGTVTVSPEEKLVPGLVVVEWIE